MREVIDNKAQVIIMTRGLYANSINQRLMLHFMQHRLQSKLSLGSLQMPDLNQIATVTCFCIM